MSALLEDHMGLRTGAGGGQTIPRRPASSPGRSLAVLDPPSPPTWSRGRSATNCPTPPLGRTDDDIALLALRCHLDRTPTRPLNREPAQGGAIRHVGGRHRQVNATVRTRLDNTSAGATTRPDRGHPRASTRSRRFTPAELSPALTGKERQAIAASESEILRALALAVGPPLLAGLLPFGLGPMAVANYMQYVLKGTITAAARVFGPAAPAPVTVDEIPEREVQHRPTSPEPARQPFRADGGGRRA
jgi:hypothetical protein